MNHTSLKVTQDQSGVTMRRDCYLLQQWEEEEEEDGWCGGGGGGGWEGTYKPFPQKHVSTMHDYTGNTAVKVFPYMEMRLRLE